MIGNIHVEFHKEFVAPFCFVIWFIACSNLSLNFLNDDDEDNAKDDFILASKLFICKNNQAIDGVSQCTSHWCLVCVCNLVPLSNVFFNLVYVIYRQTIFECFEVKTCLTANMLLNDRNSIVIVIQKCSLTANCTT